MGKRIFHQNTIKGIVALTLLVVGYSCAARMNEPKGDRDIMETASGHDQLTMFVQVVEAADLDDALRQKGPYTVFAPTNEAFSEIPEEQMQALLAPENRDKLRTIIAYHVVPGLVSSDEVVRAKTLDTINGEPITVKVEDGEVYLDWAKVEEVDIDASNGVIHVIDQLLVPQVSDQSQEDS